MSVPWPVAFGDKWGWSYDLGTREKLDSVLLLQEESEVQKSCFTT
jgi:hypothetical protein